MSGADSGPPSGVIFTYPGRNALIHPDKAHPGPSSSPSHLSGFSFPSSTWSRHPLTTAERPAVRAPLPRMRSRWLAWTSSVPALGTSCSSPPTPSTSSAAAPWREHPWCPHPWCFYISAAATDGAATSRGCNFWSKRWPSPIGGGSAATPVFSFRSYYSTPGASSSCHWCPNLPHRAGARTLRRCSRADQLSRCWHPPRPRARTPLDPGRVEAGPRARCVEDLEVLLSCRPAELLRAPSSRPPVMQCRMDEGHFGSDMQIQRLTVDRSP
jgi:hypothetical protein